jgi:hypothetical protein
MRFALVMIMLGNRIVNAALPSTALATAASSDVAESLNACKSPEAL